MKINTISAYALVYLLARGHWNLIVPVRADGEGDGSTGNTESPASHADGTTASTPADAGSALTTSTPTTGTGSKPGSRASSKAGSTSGSTAGSRASSTAGSRAGSVPDLTSLDSTDPSSTLTAPAAGDGTGADASLTVSTGADGSVASSDGSTDAGLASAEPAEAKPAESAEAEPAKTVELGSLFLGDGGSTVEYTPGLFDKAALDAKKADAMGLADEARKTAEKLKKAAEDIIKQAEELTKAAEDAKDIESLTAKMDAAAYNVGVARTGAADVSKPLDMTYYDSFPSGHHHRADYDLLIKMYKQYRRENNEMYYDGFPTGWHFENPALFDEAKKYRDEKYEKDRKAKKEQIEAKEAEITAKDGQIVAKEGEMALKKEALEDKHEQLDAKKQEVNEMRAVIAELHRQLTVLEADARTLNAEHGKLYGEFKLLEMEHKKLEDDKKKLHGEHALLEEEDRNIVRGYYELSGITSYVDGRPTASEAHVDPRDNFTSYTEELGVVEGEAGLTVPSETAEASSTVPAPEDSGAKPAEGAAPATHVTPVKEETAPATHVTPAKAEPAKEPAKEATKEPAKEAAKEPAKGAAPGVLRLFKTDDNGNEVEMETTDFTKKNFVGDDKYEFKDNVKCTKVMFGDHLLWKKGDHSVDEPVNVTYRDTLKVVVVRDAKYAVNYKKNTITDEWKHDGTTERLTSAAAKTAQTISTLESGTPSARTRGLASPGLARGSAMSGSTTNLAASKKHSTSTTDLTATETLSKALSTSTQSLTTIEETPEHKSGTGTLRGAGGAHP
ncbi:hypothetical protein MACJ_002571 [Theileria orientalis]|uniref:Uncharacterized protein n=1 Tax=Theileria orientalis TaxID=68886 RepID=A0A976M673_THEOR|nr:hypothetical protein MACJ_002571 [Theileria orientalis]